MFDNYKFNQFSQNGEDGILEEVLERIKIFMGSCVEFGAADGTFCSNTANLIQKGWDGKMIEGDEMLFGRLLENKLIKGADCVCSFVTPENVNHLVPHCDVLSIDIDGEDYKVWKAYSGKPAVVIIEINSSYRPERREICNEGTSYLSMVELGESKGYFLLCHTGNLIFVDKKYKDDFPEVKADPKKDFDKYFNYSWC